MFSTQQTGDRRQSYKTFTRGLLNAADLEEAAIHRAKHPERLSPLPEEPAASSSEAAGRLGGFARPGLPASSSGPHLPSASLILGETTALQPRMPRSASEVGRVPLSYAYGAPSTGKEKASHTKVPRRSAEGAADEAEGSVGGRSNRSRTSRASKVPGQGGGEDAASAEGSGTGGSPSRSQPAQARYALLRQRIQNTGSGSIFGLTPTADDAASSTSSIYAAKPPSITTSNTMASTSGSGLIRKSAKPTAGTSSMNTTVNIATAFRVEQERKAALAAAQQNGSRGPGTYDMEVDLYDPDASTSMEASANHIDPASVGAGMEVDEGPVVKETHQLPPGAMAPPQGDENVRKRKKGGRRSTTDPTYRYRPGDSASSDSEAGEGIGDKRGRREVKAREEAEEGDTSLTAAGRKRPPKKKARKGAGEGEDTDSQEDTGEGIAKSRGRRSLGDSLNEDSFEQATASQRRKPAAAKKTAKPRILDGDYQDSGASDDDAAADGPNKSRRRRPRKSAADNSNDSMDVGEGPSHMTNGSVTYFLDKPSSSLDSAASPQVQSARRDDTFDSSDLGASLRGESYEFEEEEKYVDGLQARDAEEKRRRSLAMARPATESVASAHSPPAPAPAPAPVPARKVKAPYQREGSRASATTFEDEEVVDGVGVRAGKKVASWINAGRRAWRKLSLWKLSVVFILLAILFGAASDSSPMISIGWRKPRKGIYTAPEVPAENVEQLVSRLSNVEEALASLSSFAAVEEARLDTGLQRTGDLNERLGKLAADIEQQSRKGERALQHAEKVTAKEIATLEDAIRGIRANLDSVSGQVRSLETDRKTGNTDLSALKKGVDKMQQDVGHIRSKLGQVEKDVARALSRDHVMQIALEAIEGKLPSQVAVRIDSDTGKLDIDPAFWRHLRSAFAEKDDVEKSIESKVSSHIARLPKSSGGGVASGRSASWADFLAQNQRSLQSWADDDFDRRAQAGAAVSRKTFLDVLKRELSSLQAEIEKSADDHYSRLSGQLAEKLAKHASTQRDAGPAVGGGSGASWARHAGDKPITIKSADGRNITGIIGEIIDAALVRYSKDTLARTDFALYTAGARVIAPMTSETYNLRPSNIFRRTVGALTMTSSIVGRPPVTALHPDCSVGMCWAMQGTYGQLGILLSREIVPTDVTIEHAPSDIAPDVSSAPRDFELWGFVERKADLDRLEAYRQANPEVIADRPSSPFANDLLLASGTYVPSPTAFIQTFPVDAFVRELGIPVQTVILKVSSNHGNPYTTCLYRVRVHGDMREADSTTA